MSIEKLRAIIHIAWMFFVLALLVVCAIMLVTSIEGIFGRPSHETFWKSRKYYHDSITQQCYMVLVDRFGRGVAVVPCEKIPQDLLRHLGPEHQPILVP